MARMVDVSISLLAPLAAATVAVWLMVSPGVVI